MLDRITTNDSWPRDSAIKDLGPWIDGDIERHKEKILSDLEATQRDQKIYVMKWIKQIGCEYQTIRERISELEAVKDEFLYSCEEDAIDLTENIEKAFAAQKKMLC